jgi:hypothetical protein
MENMKNERLDIVNNLFNAVVLDGDNFDPNENGVGYFKSTSDANTTYSITLYYDRYFNRNSIDYTESYRDIMPGTNASFDGFIPDFNSLDFYGDSAVSNNTLAGTKEVTYTINNDTPCVFVYYSSPDYNLHRIYINNDPDTVHNTISSDINKGCLFIEIVLSIFAIIDFLALIANLRDKSKTENVD